jgi:hypothetical protein
MTGASFFHAGSFVNDGERRVSAKANRVQSTMRVVVDDATTTTTTTMQISTGHPGGSSR